MADFSKKRNKLIEMLDLLLILILNVRKTLSVIGGLTLTAHKLKDYTP